MTQRATSLASIGVGVAALLLLNSRASAEGPQPCTEDAMIVFDASKSMQASAGDNAGLRRIDAVRTALSRVLPRVAPKRPLGLITYGPGSRAACDNVSLELRPALNAGEKIQSRVDALKPDGRTPLSRSVRRAADVLDFRNRPGTIVLLTDGEETCGGDPCALARDLKQNGVRTTVHVISYHISSSIGTEGVFVSRCLADETGGTYADTNTLEEVTRVLEAALACPLISEEHTRSSVANLGAGR
jgi:Ca-activated chloride channel family protein